MIKRAWSVARTSYIDWITRPRMIIAVLSLLYIYRMIVSVLIEKADMMPGVLMNAFEPYIAVLNSNAVILLVPLMYMVLMSDFPKVSGAGHYLIIRTGRIPWFLGQLLFAAMSALTYLLGVFMTSVLPILSRSFIANGWSRVTRDFAERFPQLSNSNYISLLPPNIYNQMQPFDGVIGTTLLTLGYLLLLALVLMIFNLLGKRIIGVASCIGIIGIGAATCAVDIGLKWAFPMSNTLLYLHYTEFYRQPILPLWISYLYFPLICGVLIIVAGLQAKRFWFQADNE